MKRRLLAAAMTLAMAFSLLPTGVWAAGGEEAANAFAGLEAALKAFDSKQTDEDGTEYYAPAWSILGTLGKDGDAVEYYIQENPDADNLEYYTNLNSQVEAIRADVTGLKLDDANLVETKGEAADVDNTDYYATQFLGGMEGLTYLDLSADGQSENAVDNDDMGVLAGLEVANTTMETLDISGTNVTSLDFLQYPYSEQGASLMSVAAPRGGGSYFMNLKHLYARDLKNLDVDALLRMSENVATVLPNLASMDLSGTTIAETDDAQAALSVLATRMAEMPENDLILPAQYSPVKIVIEGSENGGTVSRDGTVLFSGSEGGLRNTVVDVNKVGSAVTYAFTPAEGDILSNIRFNDGEIIPAVSLPYDESTNTYTYTIPADSVTAEGCTLTVTFLEYYDGRTITITANKGGTVKWGDRVILDGTQEDGGFASYAPVNEDAVYTIIPAEGYRLHKVTVDQEDRTAEVADTAQTDADGVTYYTHTFENVIAEHTLDIVFEEAGQPSVAYQDFKFTITGQGQLYERWEEKEILTGDELTVAEDNSLSVLVIPGAGYKLSSFLVNGEEYVGSEKGWFDVDGVRAFDFGDITTSEVTVNVTFVQEGSATNPDDDNDRPSYGGGGGGGSGSTGYAVSVPSRVEGGSVRVSPSRAIRGQTVTITVSPNAGYELDRIAVYDSDGDSVELKRESGTKYTFRMPQGQVEIAVSFARIADQPAAADAFTDVSGGDWYYDAVTYVLDTGIMSGVSETEFAPNATLTRAMAAQMLWALEGKPAVSSGMRYDDVSAGSWYGEAVRWISGQGFMSGYSDAAFGPNDPLTREQLCLILYNYAKWAGYDISGGAVLSGYADADSASAWAVGALEWAVDAGLISGRGGNTLAPAGTATRAEIAQIFMNFLENVAG